MWTPETEKQILEKNKSESQRPSIQQENPLILSTEVTENFDQLRVLLSSSRIEGIRDLCSEFGIPYTSLDETASLITTIEKFYNESDLATKKKISTSIKEHIVNRF